MWNPLTKKQLTLIPKLREQDGTDFKELKVYAKMWLANFTWYILEYDVKDDLFYAFTVTPTTQAQMVRGGEFGYVSQKELKSLKVPPGIEVDRDVYEIKPRKPKLLIDALKRDGFKK